MDQENLLIFRIGHLGDTLVALPALWAIREAFPKARITYLTNLDRKNAHYISPQTILPASGLIDEWMDYPTGLGHIRSKAAQLVLSVRLRLKKFSTLFYLMPRMRYVSQIERDMAFFRMVGIPKVAGVDYLRNNRLEEAFNGDPMRVETEAQFLLNCLAFDGIEIGSDAMEHTDLRISMAEHDRSDDWFIAKTNIDVLGRQLVAVAPGSKWASKIWDESRYAQVIRRLIGQHSVFPIVFGGREDAEAGDRLIAEWEIGVNAAGKLSIRESAALLQKCAIYLGNDTGTMHLAAAVGTPCVAIFAALDWRGRWEPFGKRNIVFRTVVECEGCFTPDCFNDHKCLREIGTDDVYEACLQLLGE